MEIHSVDEANAELEAMETDVRNDMGEEGVEAGFYDLVCEVALRMPNFADRYEFCRMQLGYIPQRVTRGV